MMLALAVFYFFQA